MSPIEEAWVRWSARVVVILFVLSIGWWPKRLAREYPSRRFQVVWSAGAISLFAHAVLAMLLAHHGSHAAAMEHTATRTAEFVGWRSGFGLYLNYLMTLCWLLDAGWLVTFPGSYARRSRFWDQVVLGFFGFMLLNATFVFESGVGRWIGVASTVVVIVLVARRHRSTRSIYP
jgi:hypothetical protein